MMGETFVQFVFSKIDFTVNFPIRLGKAVDTI